MCGFRAGGEAEEQKRSRVELQPGKDKAEGQDESRPEKEPVGSSDEEADWELLGSAVVEKVQASRRKKKITGSGNGNENQLHGERDEGRGWKAKWKRKTPDTWGSRLDTVTS